MKITLKAARVNADLKQGQAAHKLGITISTLSCYERGLTRPTVDMIEKMLALYGVAYDDIQWR